MSEKAIDRGAVKGIIHCEKCNEGMLKVHQYNDSGKQKNVYYCCKCDYTLVLDADIFGIDWSTKTLG